MDPDTDVYQTEQPQISYSFDFTAEQSRAIQSPNPNLFGQEGTIHLESGIGISALILHEKRKSNCCLCPPRMGKCDVLNE